MKTYNYHLFEHMLKNHGLTLIDSELNDIVEVVKRLPPSTLTQVPEQQASIGLLETIITDIINHEREHPNHGIGCSCMDEHNQKLRELIRAMLPKDTAARRVWSNLSTVLQRQCSNFTFTP